jgi:hypothetical protein
MGSLAEFAKAVELQYPVATCNDVALRLRAGYLDVIGALSLLHKDQAAGREDETRITQPQN